jgi:hypothetical protein
MSKDIKNIYNDALYWATSPESKQMGYHISRVHDSILRKLIHYCKNKEQVFYSNDVIAKHIYLGVEQIKKSIPLLEKKGFIKCTHITTRDDNNNIIKRRGIKINWQTFEKIMNDLPVQNNEQSSLNNEFIDEQSDTSIPKKHNINNQQIDENDFELDVKGVFGENDSETDYATEVEENFEKSEAPLSGVIESGDVNKEIVKYTKNDIVSIEKFFKNMDFDYELIVNLILQIREKNLGYDSIQLALMFRYIQEFIKEQKYNDYRGVFFTPELINAINARVLK